MLADEIRRVIEASPLPTRVDEIMKLTRPALHLRTEPVGSMDELPLGATRRRVAGPRCCAWSRARSRWPARILAK